MVLLLLLFIVLGHIVMFVPDAADRSQQRALDTYCIAELQSVNLQEYTQLKYGELKKLENKVKEDEKNIHEKYEALMKELEMKKEKEKDALLSDYEKNHKKVEEDIQTVENLSKHLVEMRQQLSLFAQPLEVMIPMDQDGVNTVEKKTDDGDVESDKDKTKDNENEQDKEKEKEAVTVANATKRFELRKYLQEPEMLNLILVESHLFQLLKYADEILH
jgi:hypothetical protein